MRDLLGERSAVTRIAIGSAFAAVVLAACGGGAEPSGDVAEGPGDADAVVITATDNEFAPSTLELDAGAEVQVEVANDGDATHDFTIETLDVSTGPIDADGVATATFAVPEGETTFVCSLHAGMEGQIVGTS